MSVETRTLWLAAIALAGCGFPKAGAAPGPVSPTAVEAARSRSPEATAATLESGQQLFLSHCNACHSYPDRASVTADRWPGIVGRMAEKAHLTPSERDLVLQFVLATRDETHSSGGAAAP